MLEAEASAQREAVRRRRGWRGRTRGRCRPASRRRAARRRRPGRGGGRRRSARRGLGVVDPAEEQRRRRVVDQGLRAVPQRGLEVLGRDGVAAVRLEPLGALAHAAQRCRASARWVRSAARTGSRWSRSSAGSVLGSGPGGSRSVGGVGRWSVRACFASAYAVGSRQGGGAYSPAAVWSSELRDGSIAAPAGTSRDPTVPTWRTPWPTSRHAERTSDPTTPMTRPSAAQSGGSTEALETCERARGHLYVVPPADRESADLQLGDCGGPAAARPGTARWPTGSTGELVGRNVIRTVTWTFQIVEAYDDDVLVGVPRPRADGRRDQLAGGRRAPLRGRA